MPNQSREVNLFGSDLFRAVAPLLESLGTADRERIEKLVELAVGEKISLQACLDSLYPDKSGEDALKALRNFRKRFNDLANESKVQIQFAVDTKKRNSPADRICWFTGPSPLLQHAESFSDDQTRAIGNEPSVTSRGISTSLGALEKGKRVVNFFVSYAHEDEQLMRSLVDGLKLQFSASKTYELRVWTDHAIRVGTNWTASIERAIAECDFGLFSVSPAFLGSKFITEHEIPRFLEADGTGKTKPVIPVAMRKFSFEHHDLKGLEIHQIYLGEDRNKPVFFEQKKSRQQKHDYCHNLFIEIERRLNEHFSKAEVPDRQRIAKHDRRRSPKVGRCDRDLLDDSFQPELCVHFQPTSGRAFNLGNQESIDGLSQSAIQSKDALTELERWAANPKSSPFFALLGEYGMGKTTTLRQLTQRLLELRKSDSSSPLPIYIDLRDYVSNEVNSQAYIPTIEELLETVIKRNHKLSDREITAEQILDLVRNQGAVILFDGLDEKIVHMKQPQAQAFIRCLWSVIPDLNARQSKGSRQRGKLLISCRSHYFRDVASQNSMLSGEGREGFQKREFPAFCLLPFTEEQVLGYLESLLKSKSKAKEAFDLICSIHNLRDLAERPYLLSLIANHLHEIERLQSKGEVVNAARLYELFVNSWFSRDDGKHQLDPAHKHLLMERLAADLWNSGEKQWDADRLESWLDQFLYDHPVIASAYANVPRVVLKEDLRTATFVVRPDTEEKLFKFAHTSLQEYFLARHLVRGLREQKFEGWDCLMPSLETFSFIGQMLIGERQDRIRESLNSILAGESVNAARNAFRYWLQAIEHNYLQPTPGHVNLAGTDLRKWTIIGTKERPLNLNGANLAGAKLNESTLKHVNLQRATLSRAEARDALFLEVNARGMQAQDVDFRGLKWRGGSIADADLTPPSSGKNMEAASKFAGCQFLHVDSENVALPERWDLFGAIINSTSSNKLAGLTKSSVELQFDLGHSGEVCSCSFSPDGSQIVSSGADGSLKLWDVKSGKCLRTFKGHAGWVPSCGFSPDGLQILSGEGDGSLKLWDVESGACLRAFKGHSGWVKCCSFNPDGSRIVSGGSDGSLKLWDAESAVCLQTFQGSFKGVESCSFSSNGSQIISVGDDGLLQIWDTASGICVESFELNFRWAEGCSFSSDSSLMCSIGIDGSMELWDTQNGIRLRTFEARPEWVEICSLSPDGKRIVSVGEKNSLKLWDALSGISLQSFEEVYGGVGSCRFSPDGSLIVSGGRDGSLKLWDAESGVCLRTFKGNAARVPSCSFSPDGSRIASGTLDGSLHLWDAESGVCLRTSDRHFGWVPSCGFSPDGSQIVSVGRDGSLKLWDAQSGACLRTIEVNSRWLESCSFSPNGSLIVTGGADGLMKLWDTRSGACLQTFEKVSGGMLSCSFSPDGLQIVSGGEDASLKLWDTQSGACLRTFKGHAGAVESCSFSADGSRVVSGARDGSLKLWDLQSGTCLRSFEGHSGWVNNCSFSPDSLQIISGGADGSLNMWDTQSGVCLRTFEGHFAWVESCSFSEDGSRIFSGGRDGSFRIWDAQSGACLRWIQLLPSAGFVTIDHTGEITNCSENAWQYLGLRWTDPRTNRQRLLPAETFGPLPVHRSEKR